MSLITKPGVVVTPILTQEFYGERLVRWANQISEDSSGW